jgi:hypothetical protein
MGEYTDTGRKKGGADACERVHVGLYTRASSGVVAIPNHFPNPKKIISCPSSLADSRST